jgi:hypothetical protein
MDEKCVRDPRHDCFGLEAAARLEGRIKALEDWQRDSKKFHNSFYDWQREQIEWQARLDERLKSMEKDIKKSVEWQESQQSAPKKRWDAIVDKSVWAVLAAVIAFILARIGL